MKNSIIWKRCVISGIILFFSVLSSGCMYTDPQLGENEVAITSSRKSTNAAEISISAYTNFALMAEFAKFAYRKDLSDQTRKESECAYLTSTSSSLPYADDMPANWRRLTLNDHIQGGCFSKQGLFYETYIHIKDDEIDRAVIAIRGTDNTTWQMTRNNWAANMSGIPYLTSWLGWDYEYARNTIPGLIKSLRDKNPKIKVDLVGHSLGGGIAQYVAYSIDEGQIDNTYTFDTSPVTRWTYLKFHHEIKDEFPRVFRIYLNNEVLQDLREGWTRMTLSPSYNRIDYEFNFKPVDSKNAHSMSNLACQMARWRLLEPDDENEIYNRADAEKFLRSSDMSNPKDIVPVCLDTINKS